ncbi:MAG: hypothetical protein RIR76_1209 [Verrucomicrobiota bacterium]|jgi:hypothetical protein
MKAAKIVVIALGSLLALVVIAGAVALSSGFQTWAVRKALARQPGLDLEVGEVAAGLSSATVRGVKLKQPGLALEVGEVSARYSAWAYLSGGMIDFDEIDVKGIAVDLRSAPAAAPGKSPAPQSSSRGDAGKATGTEQRAAAKSGATAKPGGEKPAEFEGLLKAAQLPVDLRVRRLSAAGNALLPDGQRTSFELRGEDLKTGAKGRLEWKIDYADARKDATVTAVKSSGTLTVTIGTGRAIEAADLEAEAAAKGAGIPADTVKLTGRVARGSGGDEDYTAALSLLRNGKSEQLVSTKARFTAAAREVAGNWEIALRSEQLAALLAGFGLPEVAASGSGKYSVKPAAGAAAANGNLEARVAELGKLSPALGAIGAIGVKSSFDGAVAEGIAEIRAFSVDVADANGRTFAGIKLLQKAVYRLTDRQVSLPNPGAEAARLTLEAVPVAWAQPSLAPMRIESGTLSVSLAIEGEPDGSRVRLRSTTPLTLAGLTVRDGTGKALLENITLSVAPAIDYTPTRLTARLADLKLSMTTGDSMSGEASADIAGLATKPTARFGAKLQAKLVTLAKPFLAFDPGPLTVDLQADGRHEADTLQLTQAKAVINRDGDRLLAAVELLQGLRAETKSGAITSEKPDAPTARVRMGAVPLAWAEPYVAGSKIAGEFAGTALEVTLRSKEDVALRITEPLVLRGVTASLDGKPLVQGADLTAALAAQLRQGVLSYEIGTLEIRQGETPLLNLKAAGELKTAAKPPAVSAKGKLEADAGALLRQPALTGLANLGRGRVTATFDVTADKHLNASAVVSARALATRTAPRELGDVDLSLTAALKENGDGSLKAPLTVTAGGRKSDLLVEGSFGRGADQKSLAFKGRLTSANLVVDDLQALSGLAPANETTPAAGPNRPPALPAPGGRSAPAATTPAKPAGPARDTKPFWSGLTGRAEVDLKRVLYGKDYTIRAIKGAATITDSRLSLDGLEGSFRDQPFKLATAVTFNAVQPQPYALTGLVDITGIEIGEVLRAATPQGKPMLETTVKVAAKLAGNGLNAGHLLERTYGSFEVTGSKGVLRALGRKGETVTTATALIGLAGALAGGGQRVAAAAGGVSQLGRELEEMKFDGLTVKLERDAALNLNVNTIEFLSPTTRLAGKGRVTYVEGKGFEQWPLQFEFRLGGKGYLQQLLNEARVLSGELDDKGYATMGDAFTIGGTASGVTTNLWQIIARAGLGGLLR